MADANRPTPTSPAPAAAADPLAALYRLPDDQAEAVRQLAGERDNLFLLYHALVEVERAPALEARLRVFVDAIRKIGFGRVAITLRDAALDPTLVVTAGLTREEEAMLRDGDAGGDAWRRRLASLERFRVGQSFYLDGRDEWVRREFRSALPSQLGSAADPERGGGDALLVPLKGGDGRVLATLVLDEPADGARPSLARVRTVELFGQQVVYCIEQARLVELAQRRAERLQRLHEVGSLLARSLDEWDIVRELARQVARVLPYDGIVIARPDTERHAVTTALRLVRGVERPRPATPLGHGPVAEVARTARPVRLDDYDPERHALAAADDVVGDGGPARSVLAVPMLLGVHLVGVVAIHAAAPGAYAAEDEEVLLAMASQAATAIGNARLYATSQRERRQTEALADVARAVSASLRLADVLRLTLRHATALLHAEGATVALRQGAELEVVAGAGTGERLVGTRLPVQGSMTGRTVEEGAYTIANDGSREPEAHASAHAADVQKTVIVPLVAAGGAIGALAVINRAEDFTDDDARVLHRLADHVAVAIVNARLFEEVAEATREWAVAFDAVASGMALLDAEGRVLRANARAVQLTGAPSREALVGCAFHEAVLGEAALEGCVHHPALAQRVVARGTHQAPGRGRVYDVVASPHPAGGAVVTFDDVTEHHALAERYRRVVETASDGIVITDRQRRIAYANPAAERLFGRAGALVGTAVRELVPPESADEVRERETRAFAGEPQRYESVIVRGDGERRTVSVSTSPLREVGEVTGIVASLRDVTDERRARERVSQTEARYRNLFETASDAIYTLDARGAFTSANQATCDISGRPREALLGRPVRPLLLEEEFDAVKEHFKASLAGSPRRFECHLARADGTRRLLSVTSTPIRHGAAVIGVLGVARDVTAERERAEALARSEARYTRLVESASDAIFTVDLEGRFTSVNRALERAVGHPRAALVDLPFTEVVDERDRDATWQVFRDTIGGERRRAEFRYRAASGEPRRGWIITAPIQEGDVTVGALGIVRDVTEEKRLAEQLLQQEKLAAIGQLVSGVAHELNNPLAGVTAFSQLLLATAAPQGDQQHALQTIHQEARRAAKIVSNLLTFARQHPPERRVTDLNQVFLDTLELRRYAIRMQQIELVTELDPALPATWADSFQLQQVFLNLISNAEHALAAWPGERRITVRSWRDGDVLAVSVADTGEGIAPENLDRVFNPFYTTKPVGQGTGLGLSIADGIVREHGGRIRVESRPGGGATFVVELPRVAPPEPHRAPPAPTPAVAPGGRSVLVVDDEPSVRGAITTYLRSLGIAADGAASGAAALARVRERRYDAILLDLRMPDMPGDAVYAELAAADPALAERVVFLTGDLHSEAAAAFVRSTGRPFVSKPFELDDLARVLFAGSAPDGAEGRSPRAHPARPVE